MNEHDRTLLLDMLAAAERAVDFVDGRSLADFEADAMRSMAVERCIEIVGEAASKLSDGFKAANADLPLREAVTARNRIIHGYRTVRASIIHDTVTRDLVDLVARLHDILKETP